MSNQVLSCPTTAESAAGPDRRTSIRYPCGKDTVGRLIQARTGELWVANVRDLSTNGIGLVLPRRFEPGTLLAFELHNSAQNFTRTMLGKVMRVSSQDAGDWMLGCALATRLSDDELETLRAERVRTLPPAANLLRESRAWVRCTFGDDSSVASPLAASGDQWPATILNMSPGRIGLLVPRPFKRGSLLKVELQGSADNPARTLTARVLFANAQFGGEWSLTCSVALRRSPEDLAVLRS